MQKGPSMMKKHLVTYATPGYYPLQEMLEKSALKHGIDNVFSYRRPDIERTEFYKENRKILDKMRYAGYALWKPYIILDALNRSSEGDIVLYCDSDMIITGDLTPLMDICVRNSGIMLFGGDTENNRQATKRDAFVLMGCDSEKYWNAYHPWAGFSIWMKNDRNLRFVEEWLYYCKNENILMENSNKSGLDNFPEFHSHAPEESVLSILAVKYDIEIFRSPHPRCNYAKMSPFRIHGEPLGEHQSYPLPRTPRTEYDDSTFRNSPYPNLIEENLTGLHRELTAHEALAIGLKHHRDGLHNDLWHAQRIYESVLQLDPNNHTALYLSALAYFQLNCPQATEDLLDKAIAAKPDFTQALYFQGVFCNSLGKEDKATACFRAIMEHEPKFITSRLQLDQSVFELPEFRLYKIEVE